ncbi:MAG: hypothetical protein JXL80_16380 [Planctomycetes bacterium]|nr:hypothetical protein [Planctomycetota bacterium]
MGAAFREFCGDEGDMERMREFFSPAQVDQSLRQAVMFCWMMLPPQDRSVDRVEAEVRRIMDRVLRDWHEDAAAFGVGGSPE